MADELKEWLLVQSESLCGATLYRAPNMLPDERDVSAFVTLLAEQVGMAMDEQLTAVQSWALTTIGRDAMTAGDWLTILRVLKEEIGKALQVDFSAEATIGHWTDVDYLLTSAIIEAAQLTSYMGQADLLEHTIKLREELERLEQSKTNFITVGAHELRTPLTIIEGYANMLRVEADPDSSLRLYVSGMENGLLRMQEIIADMIDVSLIDLQGFELNYQKVDLERIVLLVADNLQKHFAKRRVDLVIEPFEDKELTYGDPQTLAKAFEKVVLNGLKYTPDGGRVSVTGSFVREPGPIPDVTGYSRIQVVDTGIGIDPSNLERIFDKFSSLADVRLHSSSKTAFKGGGAGLGLPITKGIIEAHGGRIWADSPGYDEGSYPGSTFVIELPIYTVAPISVDE